MIYPIVGFGHPTLKKKSTQIDKDYPNLKQLISDMFETMYAANGVGLAAPQIDIPIRLVVIGFPTYDEKTDTYSDIMEEHVLINPEIIEYRGEKTYFNEGCLSVPGVHEDVMRNTSVVVKYQDIDFNEHIEEFTGMLAHAAQHEIDHLEGTVFVDRLSAIRKTIIRRKLNDIIAGKVDVNYRMKRLKK